MNTIKRFFALATLVLLLPGCLNAQEKTTEVLNLSDVTSIVRETRSGLWLVCNNSSGRSRFTLVDESLTSADQLWLDYVDGTDSMRINDFEIFRDTVYFCGQIWYGDDSYGIWGYFPLNGFPSVDVYYNEVIGVSCHKLDVFSVDTTTIDLHVVLLGHMGDIDPDFVIDEVRLAPNFFTENKSYIFDNVPLMFFYDVEVTDLHVAISTSADNGSVLFINKPTTIGTTIFTCTITQDILNVPKIGIILLEYCKNNYLVAVYKYKSIGYIHLFGFSTTTPLDHLSIDGTEDLCPRDVKFNRAKDDLDLLATPLEWFSRGDSSMIYHLNYSLVAQGGPLFCHKYRDHKLNSLAWLSTRDKCFVASGHDINQHYLKLYRYQFDYWGECTEEVFSFARKQDVVEQQKKPQIDFYHYNIQMSELESRDMNNPLKVTCGK